MTPKYEIDPEFASYIKLLNERMRDAPGGINCLQDSMELHLGACGDTLVVAPFNARSACLAADRAWSFDSPPADARLYGATKHEEKLVTHSSFLIMAFRLFGQQLARRRAGRARRAGMSRARFVRQMNGEWRDLAHGDTQFEHPNIWRRLCQHLNLAHDVRAFAVYPSQDRCDGEFGPGATEVTVVTLSNVPIVDDRELTWPQVSELRADAAALSSYRSLIHSCCAAPLRDSATQDDFGQRLHHYKGALAKHGVTTRTGRVSHLLWLSRGAPPKGSLSVEGVRVSVAKEGRDVQGVRPGPHGEVAMVHELDDMEGTPP